MKKTFYLTAILIIGFGAKTLGQDSITLDFTAQNNGQHVALDSILIMNLTQDADTMLYGSDTVLVLYFDTLGVNVRDLHSANSFTVSQNYPNPFIYQTFIDIGIVKRDDVQIRIFDLSGREHVSYKRVLDAGKHTFAFYPGNADLYIFSVLYDGLTRSIKMANPLSGNQECKLTYTSFEKREGTLKSQRDASFPYDWGDNLRYIGYSTTTTMIRGSGFIEDGPLSNESYLFEIRGGFLCVDVPTVIYNFQLYNTLQIGTQCWLKENLNVGAMIIGIQPQWNNGVIEKYCYDDDPANCNIYGGLYQWDEMMQYTTQPGAQGICPDGWHIPTDEEWKQLEGEVDSQYGYPDPVWDTLDFRGFDVGERLKSQNSWYYNGNGSDFVGFSALATGARRFDGAFLSMGIYTSFWSSMQTNSMESWYRYVMDLYDRSARYSRDQSFGRSVRCVKDE